MMGEVIGSIISGGMGLIGDNQDRKFHEGLWNKNYEMQKEFAQNGIRWRVEDAKAAGLHPLAAIGASGASGSPITIDGGSTGNRLASMGQDISRAINSTRTSPERVQAQLLGQEQIKKAKLENQLLEDQVRSSKIALLNPNPPSPTLTNDPAHVGIEQAVTPEIGYARTSRGNIAMVPSAESAQRQQSNFFSGIDWMLRNRLTSLVRAPTPPPSDKFPLPKGYYWHWNPILAEFEPYRSGEHERNLKKFTSDLLP